MQAFVLRLLFNPALCLQVLCLIHATSRDAAGKAGMIEVSAPNQEHRCQQANAACLPAGT